MSNRSEDNFERFLFRTTITSVENPDFEIWLELNSPYEFSTAYSANNRTDSLHHKLLSYRQNRNDTKIYSGVQVAILTLVRKFKRGKHPCTYYSNWILGLQIMTTSQLSQLIVLVGAVLRCLSGQQSYCAKCQSIAFSQHFTQDTCPHHKHASAWL